MSLELDTIKKLNNLNVILASASPRRKEILTKLGLKFQVIPSTFPELLNQTSRTPSEYVRDTAEAKTREVYDTQTTASNPPPHLVIGADTIVVCGTDILEKPASVQDAISTLKRLRGAPHEVLTAVVLAYPSKTEPSQLVIKSFVESTGVTFGKDIDDDMIESYVATGDPMDKAGSYGYQSLAGILVESINGCYYNMVGFPLHRFYMELSQLIKNKELPI
ncbi:hypothetical protein SmJEL517_g05118 [Synchytrium microbalum]|uniref:Septum formation protein Maf n=1 Tax=Synchytrium microbalum TaxID=1806994 RepID=A0A507C0I5_9FUNG|nr:uncharacterized protein SmJEL517_g05118 [Synchytrium microbalum]TPX31574.1 hypothetical protein SmJEL517_g05118 [Synchytrium microbalum]